MTLQAYDFLHLHDAHGCTLQVGGSDQWGNITAGIDLIRRQRQTQAYALLLLQTTASGEKSASRPAHRPGSTQSAPRRGTSTSTWCARRTRTWCAS